MAAVLVTGPPGCGKTTLVRRAVRELGVPAAGFYTEEIRSGGRREAFALVTLDGRRATLASTRIRRGPHVSRYGVDLGVLDSVGVSALRDPTARLLVIDEIGKMELLSDRFREAAWQALAGDRPVLASIMLSRHPFADATKARDDVKLVRLTREGREQALATVLAALRESLR